MPQAALAIQPLGQKNHPSEVHRTEHRFLNLAEREGVVPLHSCRCRPEATWAVQPDRGEG